MVRVDQLPRYKLLALALERHEFTLKDLSEVSGLSLDTVESWRRRNKHLLVRHRDPGRAGQRGAPGYMYRIRPERHDQALEDLADLWPAVAVDVLGHARRSPRTCELVWIERGEQALSEAIAMSDVGKHGEARELREVARRLIRRERSYISEWDAAGQPASAEVRCRIASAEAAAEDDFVFQIRSSLHRVFSKSEDDLAIRDLGEWVSGCVVDSTDFAGVTPVQYHLANVHSMAATSHRANQIWWAMKGEERMQQRPVHACLGVFYSSSSDLVVQNIEHRRRALDLICLFGIDEMGRALSSTLSPQQSNSLFNDEGSRNEAFARFLLTLNGYAKLQANRALYAWALELLVSRYWRPSFSDAISRLGSSIASIDTRSFLLLVQAARKHRQLESSTPNAGFNDWYAQSGAISLVGGAGVTGLKEIATSLDRGLAAMQRGS